LDSLTPFQSLSSLELVFIAMASLSSCIPSYSRIGHCSPITDTVAKGRFPGSHSTASYKSGYRMSGYRNFGCTMASFP
jgi:hypothetical protein